MQGNIMTFGQKIIVGSATIALFWFSLGGTPSVALAKAEEGKCAPEEKQFMVAKSEYHAVESHCTSHPVTLSDGKQAKARDETPAAKDCWQKYDASNRVENAFLDCLAKHR